MLSPHMASALRGRRSANTGDGYATNNRPLRVGLLSHQIIGTVGGAFSLAGATGAFLAGQYWPILIAAFFFLMGT